MEVLADSQERSPVKQSKTVGEIITSNASNKASERRLVEYFLVVSSVPRKTLEEDGRSTAFSALQSTGSHDSEDSDTYIDDFDFQPVISSRYPLEDHKDNELHSSVTSFCHPKGSIHLRVEACLPKVSFFITLFFF